MKRWTSLPRNLLRRTRKGLSLMEMIIVIGLIALIAGLIIPRVGGLFGGAEEDVVRTYVRTGIATNLMQYRLHMGSFPSTEQGLEALRSNPTGSNRWRGPYVDGSIEPDPWDQPYQYRYPGSRNPNSYDLWSMGPDRQNGTADDIGNWEEDNVAVN